MPAVVIGTYSEIMPGEMLTYVRVTATVFGKTVYNDHNRTGVAGRMPPLFVQC